MKQKWTRADMPGLHGHHAVITGANRGLGLELAEALATSGARVSIACRDPQRAQAALGHLRSRVPGALVEALPLDLASLDSIRRFAADFRSRHTQLDLLVHNGAAILAPLSRTQDGFELHFGTNHLAPFALTGLLLEPLLAAPAARILFTGSLAHRLTPGLDLEDPQFLHKPYKDMDAYGKSKLATLSHAFELDRRLRAAGARATAVAAHPGYTATNTDLGNVFMRLATRLFAQKTALGALPALYALTATEVGGGEYYGPDGYKELGGHPARVQARPEAHDPALAARLWALSEQLTGVSYASLSGARA